MLFGHLMSGKAQISPTCAPIGSPEAVKHVAGHQLEGPAAGGLLHLINSGAAALDGTCAVTDAAGKPTMSRMGS